MDHKDRSSARRSTMLRHKRATGVSNLVPEAVAVAGDPNGAGTGTGTGTGAGAGTGGGTGAKPSGGVSASAPPPTPSASVSKPPASAPPASKTPVPSPASHSVSNSIAPSPGSATPLPSSSTASSASTPPSVILVTSTSTPLTTPTVSVTNALPSTQSLPTNYFVQYTTTNANGQVYTVTNQVSGPGATGLSGQTSSSSSHSGFFQNKGAVAATFIIVGLAGTACILVGIMALMKRHRRKQFEREAALASEHAARTTRRPPSEIFDDDTEDRAKFSVVSPPPPPPQMTQRNVGYGGGGYGGTGYGGGIPGGGMGGYGVAGAAGIGAGAGARRDNSPPPNDYYGNMPNGNSGQPQPQPAFSRSSHAGHDDYDDYAAAGWNTNYSPDGQQQYQGGYYSQQQQQQQQPYQQQQDAYSGYDHRPRTPPPQRGGRVPIQPQNLYAATPAAEAASPSAVDPRSYHRQQEPASSSYGRNLTPVVPPGQRDRAGKGRSMMDDAKSEGSYYSDEEEPMDLQPRRSLRIANK